MNKRTPSLVYYTVTDRVLAKRALCVDSGGGSGGLIQHVLCVNPRAVYLHTSADSKCDRDQILGPTLVPNQIKNKAQ